MDQKMEFVIIKLIELNKTVASNNVHLRFLTTWLSGITGAGTTLFFWNADAKIESQKS
ncbi:hypothetical protein TWF481_008260 [Arthrobotrys musiformis]|uniref:Uncharacterized protein n=1 Tax=Arthrobotrys musiformis TaxID=47236 RepID=A0AAV9W6K2_9PEZI